MLGFAELLGNQHLSETGLQLMYDFALVPRSALIPDSRSHSDCLPNRKVPLVPPASSPCRTLGLVAIMPSWRPNWLFIWGIPDQLGLTAADDAKKLQFRMNVFWLKAARIVPKGGPRRDT